MKNLIYSALIGLTLLFSFDVNARPLFTASIFTSDMKTKIGVIYGLEFKQDIIIRLDLNLTPSLGGVGASLGREIGPFEVFVGFVTISTFNADIGREIDVAGIMVFDPTGNPSDSFGAFAELRYKQIFLRYTDYSVNYNWSAARIVKIHGKNQVLVAGESENLNRSAWWLGLAYSFN